MQNLSAHFQVIIIGGGPSGATAAYTLAKAGVKVCVIDKAVFPRNKLCGGLLTQRTKGLYNRIFGSDWQQNVVSQSRGVKFLFQNHLINQVVDYRDIAFTERELFDTHLLSMAQLAGAVVKTGTAVKLVNREQNSLVLADNTVLTYDYLLGCDGVYSAVAKSLYGNSYPIKQTLFCLETVLPIAVYPSQITEPEIHFGYVRWGYVWVFPKGDNLTVGLGGIPHHNDNLTKLFRAFIQDRFGDIQNYRIQGHHLPFGAFRPVPGLGNILLCGDAAGFVDPITGEGIAYALESGHLAAQAIIEKQSNHYSDPVGKIYCKSCLPIQQAISQANKLKWLIFPKISEKLFIKALTRSSRIPKRYIDLFSGELSYLEFTDFLKRKAGEAIRHKLRM